MPPRRGWRRRLAATAGAPGPGRRHFGDGTGTPACPRRVLLLHPPHPPLRCRWKSRPLPHLFIDGRDKQTQDQLAPRSAARPRPTRPHQQRQDGSGGHHGGHSGGKRRAQRQPIRLASAAPASGGRRGGSDQLVAARRAPPIPVPSSSTHPPAAATPARWRCRRPPALVDDGDGLGQKRGGVARDRSGGGGTGAHDGRGSYRHRYSRSSSGGWRGDDCSTGGSRRRWRQRRRRATHTVACPPHLRRAATTAAAEGRPRAGESRSGTAAKPAT